MEPLELLRRAFSPNVIGNRRQLSPSGQVQQVAAMIDARAFESVRPPLKFLVGGRGSLDLRRVNDEPR